MRLGGAIVLIASTAAPARSQAPDSGPAIRVTVDLVQVDAVVTDAKGRHIARLKPEDFRIFEGGKPQKITHFSFIEGEKDKIARLTPSEQGNAPAATPVFIAASPAAPRPSEIHRTVVLFADDLGLSADDIPPVRAALKSFVDREMQAGDLVSVMTSSGGMGVMQQLTTDKRQLYASIDRMHFIAGGRNGLTWYLPVHKIDAYTEIENEANARLNAARRPLSSAGTTTALAYAIRGLREMPGRKAIALFSDGVPGAGGLIELANRASVVIYTLDPRGVTPFSLTAADWCKRPLCNPSAEEFRRERLYRDSQTSLAVLARATGGLFIHDRNDLDQGLADALSDMGSYYLIGYQPHREDFDLVGGRPRYHRIEVKILRPGLQVRSRAGFAGVPDSAADSAVRSGDEQFRNALFSPFQANGIPVQLSAFHSARVLRAMLAIDAHALTFTDAANGRKRLDLEIVAGLWGADNKVAASSDKTFSGEMAPAEASDLAASGLLYGFDMVLPKPGSYQLRIAVRDVTSGRLGSAYSFVEVPDFRRAALALSSLTLRDPDEARNQELIRAGIPGAGSAVTRVFTPGAKLSYDSAIFGAIVDESKSAPKLQMEVRLFRGSDRIFSSPPIPVPAQQPPEIHAAGEIRLPAAMAPGNYTVQLVVYDPQQSAAAAEQWTDFTLVNPTAVQ